MAPFIQVGIGTVGPCHSVQDLDPREASGACGGPEALQVPHHFPCSPWRGGTVNLYDAILCSSMNDAMIPNSHAEVMDQSIAGAASAIS